MNKNFLFHINIKKGGVVMKKLVKPKKKAMRVRLYVSNENCNCCW